MPVVAFVDAAVDELGTDNDIVGLGLTTVKTTLEAFSQRVLDAGKDVAQWSLPLVFADNRTTMTDMITKLTMHLATIAKYGTVFDGVRKRVLAQASVRKTEYTDTRDATSRHLRHLGVPAALAKAFAEHFMINNACPKESMYLHPPSQELDAKDLTSPKLFRYGVPVVDECHLVTELRRSYAELGPKVVERMGVKVPKMVEANTNHYVAQLAGSELKWCADGADGIFQAASVPPLCHIYRAGAFDGRLKAYPYFAQRGILQQIRGFSMFAVMEAGLLINSQDFHTEVCQAHHTAYTTSKVVLLGPGDAMYFPLCTAPGIVAMQWGSSTNTSIHTGADAKNDNLEKFGAFVFWPCFDHVLDCRHSKPAVNKALDTYVEAGTSIATQVRSLDGTKAWQAKMEASKDLAED
jgi:hypothetical protein